MRLGKCTQFALAAFFGIAASSCSEFTATTGGVDSNVNVKADGGTVNIKPACGSSSTVRPMVNSAGTSFELGWFLNPKNRSATISKGLLSLGTLKNTDDTTLLAASIFEAPTTLPISDVQVSGHVSVSGVSGEYPWTDYGCIILLSPTQSDANDFQKYSLFSGLRREDGAKYVQARPSAVFAPYRFKDVAEFDFTYRVQLTGEAYEFNSKVVDQPGAVETGTNTRGRLKAANNQFLSIRCGISYWDKSGPQSVALQYSNVRVCLE
jgi:hypothetical protein